MASKKNRRFEKEMKKLNRQLDIEEKRQKRLKEVFSKIGNELAGIEQDLDEFSKVKING